MKKTSNLISKPPKKVSKKDREPVTYIDTIKYDKKIGKNADFKNEWLF